MTSGRKVVPSKCGQCDSRITVKLTVTVVGVTAPMSISSVDVAVVEQRCAVCGERHSSQLSDGEIRDILHLVGGDDGSTRSE